MANNRNRRRKRPSKANPLPYTKGERNAIIDSIVEPWKKTHWAAFLIDEGFHMLNEANLEESITKFIRYALPQIVKKILEKKSNS